MSVYSVRRILSLLLILLLLSIHACAMAAPSDYVRATPENLLPDHLYGESTVVMDADTGEILFSKNSRVRMYPASTTKIMTLLLALESGVSFDTPVTIPPEAGNVPADSSLIPVYKGEVTTFGDLLYGMMIHSGNDGANALAVLLGGSLDAFVQRMNERAAELGCVGTHFTNAHGYHDEHHYSTAQDLALITREALKYEEARKIVTTTSYTMKVYPRGEIPLSSSNSMLYESSSYYYEDCIGVKSGTHSRAGKCFVAAAERDGVRLIVVTLKCAENDNRWVDCIRMFNYGFTCYTAYSLEQMFDATGSSLAAIRISNAHKDDPMGGLLNLKITQVSNPEYERMVKSDNDGAMTAALQDFISRSELTIVDNLVAPISVGEIIGNYTYTAQNGEVITASLIAGRDVEAQPDPITLYDVFPFLRVFENKIVRLLILVLVLLVIVIALHGRAKRSRIDRRRRELYERRKREYMRKQRQGYPSNTRPTYRGRQTAVRRQGASRRKNDDDFF